MAKPIQIVVDAAYKGAGAIKKANADIKDLGAGAEKASGGVGRSFKAIGIAGAALGASLGTMALAGKMAFDALEHGSALVDARGDFEDLTASIGVTAEAMESQLGAATGGLVTNAQLIADASGLMALNLGLSADEIVAFSGAAAEFDWDMGQLADTLNTGATRGLKEMGLNIDFVKTRMAELEAQGVATDQAFRMAILEAAGQKMEAVGKKSEEAAGQFQKLTVMWTDATDAFKEEFAASVVDQIMEISGAVETAGPAIEQGMKNIAAQLGDVLGEALAELLAASTKLEASNLEDQLRDLGASEVELAQASQRAMEATGHSFLEVATQGAKALDFWTAYQDELRKAVAAENHYEDARSHGVDATHAATQATVLYTGALENGRQIGWDYIRMLEGMAGGVKDTSEAMAGLGDVARAGMEEAAAAAEENARRIQDAYTEAARAATDAFMAALQPDAMPDFGDVDAMAQSAFDMAGAFGLSVPILSDLGVKMGVIDSETAEAAAKAGIFQIAMQNLLGQLSSGVIDTSQFTGAFDALIADLQSKSLVEIEVELKQVGNPARDLWAGLPQEERQAIEIPVTFTPEQTALSTALGMIDGIPDNEEKTITFSALYDAVTPTATDEIAAAITAIDGTVVFDPDYAAVFPDATGAIQLGIEAIDGTVLMTPDAQSVYNTMSAIDGTRLTVYVDYVNTGAAPPAAAADPNRGGPANKRGGMPGVNMNVNFYGPAEPNGVKRAIYSGVEQLYADIAREGVSW